MPIFGYDEMGYANTLKDVVQTSLHLITRAEVHVNGGVIMFDRDSSAITLPNR
jgi:hypothetical protein